MDANIATVLVAGLALIGTIANGLIQLRSQKKEKQTENEAAAQRQANEMKKEADVAKQQLKDQEQKETLDEIKRSIAALSEKVDSVSNGVRSVHTRVDAMQTKFSKRLQDTEESIDKITLLLSRQARTYSSLIAMNQQNSERVQQMIRMESYNLKFTKGVADLLNSMGIAVLGLHADDEDSKPKQAIQRIIDAVEASRQEFLQDVMQENVNMFQNPAHQVKAEAAPTQKEIDDAGMGRVDYSTFEDGYQYRDDRRDT